MHRMDTDQNPIDVPTFSCPDLICGGRTFKRKDHLLAHMKNVHDRRSQFSNGPGTSSRKCRASVRERKLDFPNSHSLFHGLGRVSSIKGVESIFQDDRKPHEKPLEINSQQKTLINGESVDLNDQYSLSGDLSLIGNGFLGDLDGLESNFPTGQAVTFENVSPRCFEESSTLLPPGNLLDPGIQDQQDVYIGPQTHDKGSETNDLLGESDDQTKPKMISALQNKYAELKWINEQIRMLEELKANRPIISKDIAGLEDHFSEFVRTDRHGL